MKQLPVIYFFQQDPKVQYMFYFTGDEQNVKNVLASFPFQIKSQHVRFKIYVQDIEPKTHAWFDISNPNAKVPIVNDTIYVKLLQLKDINYSKIAKKMIDNITVTQQTQQQSKQQQENQNVSPIGTNRSLGSQRLHSNNQQQNQPTQNSIFYQQKQQQSPQLQNSNHQSSNQSNEPSQNGDLLQSFEQFDFKPKSQFTQSQPISQADLDYQLSMRDQQPLYQFDKVINEQNEEKQNYDIQQQVQAQNQQVNYSKQQNLFEFEQDNENSNDIIRENEQQQQQQQQQQNQYEGLTDREIVDLRVKQAADELQKQWKEENDYNIQRQQAKEEVESKIQKWAYKNDVRNNLRLLLSTLSDILWEDSGYQCSFSDLMADGKVKQKYRQAMLIAHPDKQNQAPPVQRYIAERVFYELNQAWNDEKNRN